MSLTAHAGTDPDTQGRDHDRPAPSGTQRHGIRRTLQLLSVAAMAVGALVLGQPISSASAAAPVGPAAPALGFNIVTRGDATLVANESEGPVAVGGDLTFDQYQIAIHSSGTFRVDPGDAEPTSLLVRGRVDLPASSGVASVDRGWIAIGDPAGAEAKRQNPNQITVNAPGAQPWENPRVFGQNDDQSVASVFRTSSFDFDAAFDTWIDLAAGLSRCAPNTTLAGANGPEWAWTSNDAYIYPASGGQRVLSLDAEQLSRLSSITFRSGAEPTSDAPLIINVEGVPADWNPPVFNPGGERLAPYILWNFGSLPTVTIAGGNELVGTLLAPSTNLDQQGNGNLAGAVYAGSFVHGGGAEVHDFPFAGEVTPCDDLTTTTTVPATTSTTVPETTTTVPATTSTTVPATTTTVPATTTTTVPETTTTVPATTSTVASTSTSAPQVLGSSEDRPAATATASSATGPTSAARLAMTGAGIGAGGLGIILLIGGALLLGASSRRRAR